MTSGPYTARCAARRKRRERGRRRRARWLALWVVVDGVTDLSLTVYRHPLHGEAIVSDYDRLRFEEYGALRRFVRYHRAAAPCATGQDGAR